MKDSPEWGAWAAMRGRCNNPNTHYYADYGGRGISIAQEWSTFERFYADMGPRPKGCSLDRIDVDGNYTPGNCRWATAKTQGRNKRKTVLMTARGRTQSLSDWADETGMLPITLYKRHISGWSDEEAIYAPVLSSRESGQRSWAVRQERAISRSTAAERASPQT